MAGAGLRCDVQGADVVFSKGVLVAMAVAVVAAGTVLFRLYSYWQETSFESSHVIAGQPGLRHGGRPGPGFPLGEEYYPPQSKRLHEEGAVTVRACVDSRGDLTGDPTVTGSSGFERLDQAAIRLARAGSGHYLPATVDDTPIRSCMLFRVHFRLQP